jgi:hypothetical protein
LSKQVEVLVEERAATESKTEHLLVEINDMQTEAKQKVENLHQPQLEELQVLYFKTNNLVEPFLSNFP